MDKNMDWIYRPINEPDLESILAEVEKALGFKLFVWQKTFIATGVFRQYGATTAEILREIRGATMKLREFIGVFEQSERLRIVKDGKEIYTGYKALMEHAELEAVMDAEVKRFCPVPEIRHKEWKKRGLMPPMKPEETPEFSFSDLQMTLYNTIYI